MFRGRGAIWILVVLVAVTFVSAYLVGEHADRGSEFDWELAGIVGTAIGTTLLAGVTASLAWGTVTEARADREERLRPTVIATVEDIDATKAEARVRLHNLGPGPAMSVTVDPAFEFGDIEAFHVPGLAAGEWTVRTVPVNITDAAEFARQKGWGQLNRHWRVRGWYHDRRGRIAGDIFDYGIFEISGIRRTPWSQGGRAGGFSGSARGNRPNARVRLMRWYRRTRRRWTEWRRGSDA